MLILFSHNKQRLKASEEIKQFTHNCSLWKTLWKNYYKNGNVFVKLLII